MRLLQTLFPGLFASPANPAATDGVAQLHRALEEIKPSTESLKRKLAHEEQAQPSLARSLREAQRNLGRPIAREER